MHPRLALFTTAASLATALAAQAPPTYYNLVVPTSPATLRQSLHAIIKDHTRIPYTASTTDTWDVLEAADQAPGSTTQILDLYKNALYAKQGGGNTFYNREHTWPNSYGFPVDVATNYPYTDCHHLFLCDIAYNGARDNSPYQLGAASWTIFTTLANAGQGGGATTFPGNHNWSDIAQLPIGAWQTWSGRKGDVARALFYLDVRYEGGVHGVTQAPEPDLRLTDDLNLIDASATGANGAVAYMGKLSVLLQWHAADPVDSKEMQHNNAVFALQGNRNPFVDHPEWVACLYQNQCARARLPEVWINEIHYDNTGTDVNEFVELAGPAGDSLAGWMLYAVDGATGAFYAKRQLAGVFPNQQNGFGTLAFPLAGLQDGAPDGLAIVSNQGVLVHFVGYEGSFLGTQGVCANRVALDIGVSEPTTTPVGFSLQLGGTGATYAQFSWQAAMTATPGARNTNQTFQ